MQIGANDRPPWRSTANGSALDLTMATCGYDHLRDLATGDVRAEGISLTSLTLPIEEIHHRFQETLDFDLAEASFAKYIALVATGSAPIVALPVFPARLFRHSAMYVRRGSGISSPRDLEGRVVGIPELSVAMKKSPVLAS